MVSAIISTETRKFLETTSVRGIPRIIKSKSKVLFVIWLVGVLTCTGVLIWQLAKVFIKYSEYPVNTLFVQAPDWQNPTFPDITVCNICPLVHENTMSLRYTDYIDTLSKILTFNQTNDYFESSHNMTVSEDIQNNGFIDLMSPSAYFSNFPISNIKIADPNNDPTLSCDYFDWNYNPSFNDGVCMANITPIYDPDYYKCYKFTLANTEQRHNVRGFSAIFYVDKFLDSQGTRFYASLQDSHATGMRVAVHAAGTEPDMKLGINVSPGMETTITLSQTLTTHLPEPYSNCTDQKTIGTLDETTTYTQDYCLDVCLQKQYIENCSCVWGTLQFSDKQLLQVNGTICGNLSITENNSTVNLAGVFQLMCTYILKENPYTCFDQCRAPCTEYSYSTSVSAASWPHISSQVSFYNTYILDNNRYGNAYDEYHVVDEESFLPDSNSTEILQKLDSQGLIARDFLQLNIQFGSQKFDIRKDVAAIPFEALGAQIGGILSLWLGVTIMLIFEVFEYLITIVSALYQSKQGASTTKIQCAELKQSNLH